MIPRRSIGGRQTK